MIGAIIDIVYTLLLFLALASVVLVGEWGGAWVQKLANLFRKDRE